MILKRYIILLLLVFAQSVWARNSITLLFPGKGNEEPWKTHEEYLRKEANKRNINLTIYHANYSHKKQYSQMERAAANFVDAVILVPVNYLKAGIIVDLAAQQDIKVITYGQIPMQTKNISMHVAFDYNRVGQIKAKYLIKNVPSGNYLIFSGSPTDYVSSISYKGLMNILNPYIGRGYITLLGDRSIIDGTYQEAFSLSSSIFAQGLGNIDAIVLPNDNIATAVIQALNQTAGNNKSTKIIGSDINAESAKRIILGTQSMSVLLDSKVLALQALDIANYLSNNQFVPVRDRGRPYTIEGVGNIPTYYVEPIAITKYNIDKDVIEPGIIKKREVYTRDVIKILKAREQK